ncbi:MAG: DNA-formamidopyrimidine glycosylase family protein [Chitinophagaceae bacterium]
MEGPGLVVLKEEAQKFIGAKVRMAHGSQKIDMDRLTGQTITDIKTWGKHLLILFENCTVRIHYLMFGNYYFDSRHPEKTPKLALELTTGEWNNYNCAAKIIEGTNMDSLYDWSTDIMHESWNPSAARKSLQHRPNQMLCDALMDQTLFTGVGNVIKNETLFRLKMHPESSVGALKPKQIKALVEEARTYSFDFYRWEIEGTRHKKYCVHRRAWCPDCKQRLSKKFTGDTPRSSFYCTNCQLLYA